MNREFSAIETLAPEVKEPNVATEYTHNDAGHAALFVDRYHERIRYVTAWDEWLAWKGSRWVRDSGEIIRLAVELSRDEVNSANEIENAALRKSEVSRAVNYGNTARIDAMLKLARHDERIALDFRRVDSDPWIIGAPNGVIDLRTGTLREQSRNDYTTQTVAVPFDPAATCPRWDQFVSEIMDGDQELVDYAHKAIGHCLSGDVSEHVFFFLYGTGANGKSTLCETVQSVMGDYAQRAGDSLLRQSDNGRDPAHEIADLYGSRIVFSSEVASGMRLNEKLIKDISGGDTLKGRRLYQEPFQYRPQFKLWIFGNHKPRISGTDDGIWRRVRLIPFNVQFTGDRKDAALCSKLATEAPGILAWMVRGCLRWQAEGLDAPAIVEAGTTEYRTGEDVLLQFTDEHLLRRPGDRVRRKTVYDLYARWAEGEGIRQPWSSRAFYAALGERGWRFEDKGGERYLADAGLVEAV